MEVRMFQFHSGSIKRWIHRWQTVGGWAFQFHSGSIKSFSIDEFANIPLRFNSIVVRLKEWKDQIIDDWPALVSIP